MPDEPVIFVSYRRSNAGGHARALHDYLSRRFGDERIFFDRSTIKSGEAFTDRIRKGVENCAALLALIGPGWLDVKDSDGNRRLENPEDLVRREISLGLANGKKVIPVLFDDEPVPDPARLPEPLKALAALDVLQFRGETIVYRTQRVELVRLLAEVPGIPEPYPEPGEEKPESRDIQISELVELRTRPLEQLTDAQRQTIEALKGQVGANEAQLQAFFEIVGEAKVPAEQQWTRLNEIAAQFRELKAQVAPEPGDAPEIARLKQQVSAALDAGRMDEADELLSQIEAAQDDLLEKQQREIEEKRLDRAATTAERGGFALTRLRYREAAEHYTAAAKRVPSKTEKQALDYLHRAADALYCQGAEFGDNEALVCAISRFRKLLDLTPRARYPLGWAIVQRSLGIALRTLGERESGTGRLEEAVDAQKAALEEFTRELIPLEWAKTQGDLGTALGTLGERRPGTEHLEEAVIAFKSALKKISREQNFQPWASIQNNLACALNNLACALWMLGERQWAMDRLEEAASVCHSALVSSLRKQDSLLWASIQNNLGNALRFLGQLEWSRGQRDSGKRHLEDAIAAHKAALEECYRERKPLLWATIQNNLGDGLWILGMWQCGTGHLEDAIAAYKAALEERSRERVALPWAVTQNNLANPLSTLGERKKDVLMLKEARLSVLAAFEVYVEAGLERYRTFFEDRLRKLDEQIADMTRNP